MAIIGRTGSGKSTLIQHFNGLFQPKSGAYFFNGENIGKRDEFKKASTEGSTLFSSIQNTSFLKKMY